MPMNVPTVDETHGHDHFHGTLDPALLTSEKGIWAVKWSKVGLLLTALLQGAVVAVTSSVALLSDTIHNVGDAATAIPRSGATLKAVVAACPASWTMSMTPTANLSVNRTSRIMPRAAGYLQR